MSHAVSARLLRAAVLLIVTFLAGCANLQGVQNFARSYDQLATYPGLTRNFVDTYAREQPYLPAAASDAVARETDQKRQAAQADLLKIHTLVGQYMGTLGKMAGDTTFETHSADSAVSSAVQEHPELGMNALYVEALSRLSTLTARWAIAQLQVNAVRDMIRDGDEAFQTIVKGMKSVVRLYRKTAENEKKNFTNFYEVELMMIDPAQNRLLVSLARAHSLQQVRAYDQVIGQCQTLENNLESMAAYHAFLAENSDAFRGAGAATSTTQLIHKASDTVGW